MRRLSQRYQDSLSNYLEWQQCSTPMRGIPGIAAAIALPLIEHGGCTTAAEWMQAFESRGISGLDCCEIPLLRLYWIGKANRDWWSKEVGRWKNQYAYLPEEFMHHLMPLCFIEVFGRGPITELVRYFHDNRYSRLDFKMDMLLKRYLDGNQRLVYFQRDERHGWVQTVLYLARLMYFDPWIWKLRHPIQHWRASHQ